MKSGQKLILAGLGACLSAAPTSGAMARSAIDSIVNVESAEGGSAPAISAPTLMLECVPYARDHSGIQIRGDAHTWWKQAAGRYARGHQPRVGAVMAMPAHGNSELGHVATVSDVVDSRTILLSHANWSYPGKVERNVVALDVSEKNDWSSVRIWYGPSRSLGASSWPVSGFIYNAKPGTVKNAVDKDEIREAKTRGNDPIGAIIASAE